MSEFTFCGPQPGVKDVRTRTKGIMRKRKAQKRREAEERNARTPDERRARFRISEDEIRIGTEVAAREDEQLC